MNPRRWPCRAGSGHDRVFIGGRTAPVGPRVVAVATIMMFAWPPMASGPQTLAARRRIVIYIEVVVSSLAALLRHRRPACPTPWSDAIYLLLGVCGVYCVPRL
jgi:hypothetical protein